MVDLQAQDSAQEIRPRSSPPHTAASLAAYFHSTDTSLLPTQRSAALGSGQSTGGSENDLWEWSLTGTHFFTSFDDSGDLLAS